MSEVVWLPEALGDVDRLRNSLREKSPSAAARAARRIWEGAKLLETAPYLGRLMGDGTGRRELSVPFGASAYVLRYMVEDEETVVVVRVWHSRESRAE
jgi:addiction module RelE/StbE family toxin